MRKWMTIAIVTLGVAAAGSAFGLFRGRSTAGEVADSPAPVVVEAKAGSASTAGGCGSGGCGGQTASKGGCCSSGSTAASGQDPQKRIESIQTYLTNYFAKSEDGEFTVEVEDFGCHQEARVSRNGKPYKRFSISGNQLTEIS